MMKTTIKIGVVIFFLVSAGFTMYSYDRADDGIKILNDDDYDFEQNEYHQGPVPLGYNLEHFRKTGETIKEVSDGSRT